MSFTAQAPSGSQSATFSYFKFNPAIHGQEKPFEILMNLPKDSAGESKIRRTNQEFEDHSVVVNDTRGSENEFTLEQNGVCWRRWDGPRDWKNIDADDLRLKGHEWVQEVYIKEIQRFIKSELELQDGQSVDLVKVFDYKVRRFIDQKGLSLVFGISDPNVLVILVAIEQRYQGFQIENNRSQ